MRLDVYHHFDDPTAKHVADLLAVISGKVDQMAATLADVTAKLTALTADVTQETSIETSLVALLNSMAANNKQLAADLATAIANENPAGIQAVADQLDADSTALAGNISTLTAAVTANTPPPAPTP